jgi:putative copper export protein
VLIVIPQVDTERGVAAFDRFGHVAERAVAVLVVTGIVQMLRLHGYPLSMLTNRHGLLLLLKISLVALMLWLAARNRRELGMQRRRESTQPKTLRRLLVRASLIETAIGGVVLVITSVLVATSPT